MRETDPWMELEALEDERFWANAEMAELEAAGRQAERERKAGRCSHGWGQTKTPSNEALWSGKARNGVERTWASVPMGSFFCFHCGSVEAPA